MSTSKKKMSEGDKSGSAERERAPGKANENVPSHPAKPGAGVSLACHPEPKRSTVPTQQKASTSLTTPKKCSSKKKHVEPSPEIESLKERLNHFEGLLTKVVDALPKQTFTSTSSENPHFQREGDNVFTTADEFWDNHDHDMAAGSSGPLQADYGGNPGEEHGGIPGEEPAGFGLDSDDAPVPSFAAKFAVPTGVGKPLDSELANSASYLMGHNLEEKTIEETATKYPCPANCILMDAPKVNTAIWENLPAETRSRDLKLQRIQKALTKGIGAFVQTLDSHNMSDTQQDALALLCNANFEMNCMRKDMIRPDMNKNYTHLCKPANPVTKLLFGDELGKKVKDLQDQHKAAAGVMRGAANFPKPSYHPYRRYTEAAKRQARDAGWFSNTARHNPGAGNMNTNRPFLGRRPSWRGRPAPHTQTPQTGQRRPFRGGKK
ncbi:uncharacterized protein LOC115923104 [Strongylocentrotus purpuratus]|uniref:Uncharacterized protein n=1 Tax=Strongylocentrotus purpuratus TaxID=7668 RepID=A0A7M7NN94_STRPU|nr:uncharacterized protein LOC115923104 [Strongylocentrotus purpuratus]